MPKLTARANKTLVGISACGTCMDRHYNSNQIFTEFWRNCIVVVMFIMICQNSQHVPTKRSLAFQLSARAWTGFDWKTKLIPSFGEVEFCL